jgi:hypothetical protein
VGVWVKHLGDSAYSADGYFGTYAILAVLIVASLPGLFFLRGIRKREHLETTP